MRRQQMDETAVIQLSKVQSVRRCNLSLKGKELFAFYLKLHYYVILKKTD